MTDIIVKETRIAGTNCVVYSAWEPSSMTGPHHTITTVEGKWYGRVGTNRITSEINALPGGSDERINACRQHREYHNYRAYVAILTEYPNLVPNRVEGGEMEVYR